MKTLQKLSFRGKLLLIVVPIVLALLVFASLVLRDNYQRMFTAEVISQLVQISAANSALVHELQKERGASAGFIGSGGAKFRETLSQQRLLTNKALSKRRELLESVQGELDNAVVQSVLNDISTQLSRIDDMRRGITALEVPLKQALSYYTNMNKDLLGVAPIIADESHYADITQMVTAYYLFLQGKERAGIERAVLSNTFGADQFKPGMFEKFVQLVTLQTIYLQDFEAFAGDVQVQFYRRAMEDDSVSKVMEYRALAQNNWQQGNFGANAESWFKASTGRINQLKKVEDKITSDILGLAGSLSEAAKSTYYGSVFSIGLLLSVILFLLIYIQRNISKQLESITKTMAKVADDQDLSVRTQVIFDDDLGQLAGAVNYMLDRFSATMEEISSSSQQLATASEETVSTITANRKGLDSTRFESEQVAAASEQMSATIREVATRTNQVADSSDRINERARDGAKVVSNNTNSVRTLADEIKGVGDVMEELHASSGNITSVVEVIKSVAEQTNLLALNAAIEAARAGEQGRGFAVVADEVRTLAQRTQDSTSEIESIISDFGSQTEKTFTRVKRGCEQAVAVADDAVKVEQILREIETEVSSVTGMIQNIATASDEQVSTINEITLSIEKINGSSQESAAGAQQIEVVADEQAQLASRLQYMATMFRVA